MRQNPGNLAGEATPDLLCGNHPCGRRVGPLEVKETPSPRILAAQGPRPVSTTLAAAGLGVRAPPRRKVNIKILSHAPPKGECERSSTNRLERDPAPHQEETNA